MRVWEGWNRDIDWLERKIAELKATQRGNSVRRATLLSEKKKVFEGVRARVIEYFPALASGEPGVELDETAVATLYDSVVTVTSTMQFRQAYKYMRNVLNTAIKTLGWKVAPLPTLQVMSPATSLFAPSTAERWACLDRLETAFWTARREMRRGSHVNEVIQAGELLYSFIIHSGVVSLHWIKQLPSAITNGVYQCADFTWLELGGNEGNAQEVKGASRQRRVFLAPVTRLLLVNWYKAKGGSWPTDQDSHDLLQPEQALKAYLELLRSTDRQIPNLSMSALRSHAEANLADKVPPFLVEYARTPHLGTSMSTKNWLRLITGHIFDESHQHETRVSASVTVCPYRMVRVDEAQITFDHAKHWNTLSSKLSGFVRRNAGAVEADKRSLTRGIREKIQRVIDDVSAAPIIQCLAAYALHLVERYVNSPSSAIETLRSFEALKPLMIHAAHIAEPNSLDADEWQAIYETVLGETRVNSDRVAAMLVDWHRFLVEEFQVERVSLDEQRGYSVDAAILTPQEYHRAKKELAARLGRSESAEIQLVLLILGFRCGLRRSEAWNRQYRDFPGLLEADVRRPEMLVRANKDAGVKSHAATRRLPLHLLLTADELEYLRAFVRRRVTQYPSKSQHVPLFFDPVSAHHIHDEVEVFRKLTLVLRHVTGDASFKYHRLRHSFATFTLLRGVEPTPLAYFRPAWREAGGVQLFPDTQGRLFWQAAELSSPKNALASLALWLGHATPGVTLRSYSHLLDYLLGEYLVGRASATLALEQQALLTGKSKQALERFRHREELSDRCTPVAKFSAAVRMPAVAVRKQPPSVNAGTVIDDDALETKARTLNPILPYRLCLTIQQLTDRKALSVDEAIERAARSFGLELTLAREWYRACERLMSAKHREGVKATQFSSKKNKPRDTDAYSLIWRGPELNNYPAPPQSRQAYAILMKFFGSFSQWHSKEPDEARAALQSTLARCQKSKTRIAMQEQEETTRYIVLLKALGLAPHIRVSLRCREGMSKDVLAYWGASSLLKSSQYQVSETAKPHSRLMGYVDIDVQWKALKTAYFWTTLRFFLFTAAVLYGVELPGKGG